MVLKSKQLNTFFLRRKFLANKRHNRHDNLLLTDRPVEESLLNALLYGSDEVNDKINTGILLRIITNLALLCAAFYRKLISMRCVLSGI